MPGWPKLICVCRQRSTNFLILLLLLTIGLKGGIKLAQQSFSALGPQMLVAVAMGFLLTLLAFQVLSRVGQLSGPDAASILMEMGLVTPQQFPQLRQSGLFIVAFAVLFPLLAASIGAGESWMLDLSVGGITMLATLAASASYIAAPAAMCTAVLQANHTLALAAALGITFPLNVTMGWSTPAVPA